VDRLASAVFERLRGVSDLEAMDDPQRVLFAIAADAERSMTAETSTRGEGSEEEARRFLQRCVDELEPHCKEMLLLHVNEGLTYIQIAQRLGRSTKDVLGHLTRAYCALRNHAVARE
jgi:DNA-directed RNA polymerase specialized sigma24 family protein